MRERHPVPHYPAALSEGERIGLLETRLAQLWDEVWWHQLPFWQRWIYQLKGFRSPLSRFYVPFDDTTADLELKL